MFFFVCPTPPQHMMFGHDPTLYAQQSSPSKISDQGGSPKMTFFK